MECVAFFKRVHKQCEWLQFPSSICCLIATINIFRYRTHDVPLASMVATHQNWLLDIFACTSVCRCPCRSFSHFAEEKSFFVSCTYGIASLSNNDSHLLVWLLPVSSFKINSEHLIWSDIYSPLVLWRAISILLPLQYVLIQKTDPFIHDNDQSEHPKSVWC